MRAAKTVNGSVDLYAVTAVSDSGNLDMQLFLQDSSGNAFSSDHLPSIPPSLASFDLRDFHLIDQLTDGQVQLDGHISSLTDPIASTPEPSLGAPFLAAIMILLIWSDLSRAEIFLSRRSRSGAMRSGA